MDCITREMTEIELHPNHMNRGLPQLGQIIETSNSLLRKWKKPSHGDTSAFLRAKNCVIVLSWTTCIHDLSFSCHLFVFHIPAMNSVIDHPLSVPVST
jgi:hypothetical protein